MMIGTEKRKLKSQALPTSMRALLPVKINGCKLEEIEKCVF
jgi:hypothetical protein